MKIRYTPQDEAAEIILGRKSDERLQARLAKLTGGYEPAGCFALNYKCAPAVYAEYVARPTVADTTFASKALNAKLVPWWATYEQDTFTTTNIKKTDMLKPPLAMSKGQDTRSWIVDAKTRQGERRGIGEYSTTVVDFTVSEYWRALRKLVLPAVGLGEYTDNVVDLSGLYQSWSNDAPTEKKSQAYYPAIMGMYAARAVLFVDYDRFSSFLPTAVMGYEAATEALGLEPVIVKFNPEEATQEALDGSGRLIGQRQTDLSNFSSSQLLSTLEKGVFK